MTRFVANTTIERDADAVWTYAADIVRHPEWMVATDARVVSGRSTETGGRGRERMRVGPFTWDVEFEVADAVPGRRLAWKAIRGLPFELTVSLDLEPSGPASTNATYGADVRLHGPWRLLGPLLEMEGRTGPARELRQLKANVEAAPAMAAAAL